MKRLMVHVRYYSSMLALLLFIAPTSAALFGEEHQVSVISSDQLDVMVDRNTGGIAAIRRTNPALEVIANVVDRYEIETDAGVRNAAEDDDRSKALIPYDNGRSLRIKCRNAALSGLLIEKDYRFDAAGSTLIKCISLTNAGGEGFFVKHFTEATAGTAFRNEAFYFQPQKGNPRALVPATKVTEFVQLGSDQAERQRMMLMAPALEAGVVHYRHKIDGRFCLPRTGNNFALYGGWTPEGWRFSTAAFYLAPGETRTVEYRIEVNDGDVLGHYIRYRNLPELQAGLFDYSVARWVQDLDVFIDGMGVLIPGGADQQWQETMGRTEDWWRFFREEHLNLALRIGMFRPHWGDIPSEGVYRIHNQKGNVTEINLDRLYQKVRDFRGGIPGIKLGQYNILWFIDSNSEFYRQHPEAVVYRQDGGPDYEGREGRPRPSDIGRAPTYLREFGAAGVLDVTAAAAAALIRNMEFDYFYIDGSPTGVSRLNWKLKQVTQPYAWIDAYHEIRRRIKTVTPEAVLLANSDTLPVVEMNYWEYYHWRRNNHDWRHIAFSLPMAKIMAHPDAVILLHKWNNMWASKLKEGRCGLSDRQYVGYLLGFGLLPMYDNMTLPMARQRLPIVRTAKELRGSRMVNANVRPAWWRHVEPIGVEAYTLTKGHMGLIPVMSRQHDDSRQEISFNITAMNFSPQQPLFVWVNSYQPPSGDPMKADQPYDQVFKARALKRIDHAGKRISVSLDLPGAGRALKESTEPGPLQLLVVSSAPAWIHTAEGQRFHAALSEQAGITVRIAPSKTAQLQLWCCSQKATAQIFLPLSLLQRKPAQVMVDYQNVPTEIVKWDDEEGLLFTVGPGNHMITLSE